MVDAWTGSAFAAQVAISRTQDINCGLIGSVHARCAGWLPFASWLAATHTFR